MKNLFLLLISIFFVNPLNIRCGEDDPCESPLTVFSEPGNVELARQLERFATKQDLIAHINSLQTEKEKIDFTHGKKIDELWEIRSDAEVDRITQGLQQQTIRSPEHSKRMLSIINVEADKEDLLKQLMALESQLANLKDYLRVSNKLEIFQVHNKRLKKAKLLLETQNILTSGAPVRMIINDTGNRISELELEKDLIDSKIDNYKHTIRTFVKNLQVLLAKVNHLQPEFGPKQENDKPKPKKAFTTQDQAKIRFQIKKENLKKEIIELIDLFAKEFSYQKYYNNIGEISGVNSLFESKIDDLTNKLEKLSEIYDQTQLAQECCVIQ